ncbi:SRPBCC domain-containing protein [Paenibacillus sp. FSL W8-0194]|uniref:SRPBCC family protein n=1 Tax=Paenibacillus sp. FSL W8-0194 TaxID=2921711 RepID=UPI0030DD2B98
MVKSGTEQESGNGQQAKPVGLTAAAGFQIGVRRTLPLSVQEAWSLLVSPEGMKLWIGKADGLDLKPGETFAAAEGVTGELGVVKPPEQLRMRWQRPGWNHPSTLQIRVLPAAQGKATVSFHQEKLEDMHARETMKSHWEGALEGLRALADRTGKISRN